MKRSVPVQGLWLVCLLWSGCVLHATTTSAPDEAPLLNSERIELMFGSYGIEVLEDTDTLRVSNLYSRHEARKVCRTFAVVAYARPLDPRISAEHDRIVGGGSIGAVFKQAGWSVEKQHLYVGTLTNRPEFARIRALMGPLDEDIFAVHVYVLRVERENTEIRYATLAEVHHPDYLTLTDLHMIYGEHPVGESHLTDEIRRMLEITKQEMEQ